uniref:Permease n=1 Tax=Solibacter usitatus (strain Ellin6076) TaxID=234267 RepID=Q01XA1_SOLUE
MPDWKTIVRQRLAPLRLKAGEENDLTDELAQHLEDRYRELLSGGTAEAAARREVLAELDDLYPLRAGLQSAQRVPARDAVPAGDARRGNFIDDLWRDLRFAVRTMRKSPLFVLVVVLTLAFGIGANTTVFTIVNNLILNPLPVPQSSELAAVGMAASANQSKSGAPQPFAYADLQFFQNKNQVFRSLAGYTSPRVVTLQANGASERMFAELATANYFPVLGLRPALGRFFSPDEDGTPGEHPVAVMNYGTWQGRFGGAPGVIGSTLVLNSLSFTVIGVAPPAFLGINAIMGPDVWIPAAMSERLLPHEMTGVFADRTKAAFQAVGRLKPGTTHAQAQANLATIAADLAREYPATNEGRTAAVRPIRDAIFGSAGMGVGPVVFGGAVLLGVVAIVLLIACSNVANLLLARSAARGQEIAVRLAVGASRPRLVRQLLTESVLLAALGGIAGLGVAYAGLHLLFSALPGSGNFVRPKLDQTVLLFALCVSLATGFIFGAIPAFHASRTGLAAALKRKLSLANALLVGQIAFSFLLLVTAALFLRSIQRAYDLDPGFQTAHLAVFMTNPGQTGYTMPQTKAFYKAARERVAALPGVESVSWASNLPLWARTSNGLEIEGRQQRSRNEKIASVLNTVDTSFFDAAGVAMRRGRAFTTVDQTSSAPVAIVNEKLAQDFWPGEDPIGKRIRLPSEKSMRQIVGVARTANYSAWAEAPQFCVYIPLEQHPNDAMILYVRTQADPRPLMVAVQRAILAAGPQIFVNDLRTGRQIVEGGLFQARMGVSLLGAFGLLALLLASVGLYGIMAYGVTQRKREIGLRMALGAAQSSVLRLVLKQGMMLVLAGVAIGFVASLFVERLLSRMLFGVTATDPLSVGGAALILSTVALLACYLPARWASRVDPLVALREG